MEAIINEEYQKLIDKLKEVREADLTGSDKALTDEVIHCLSMSGKRPVLSDNVEQFMSVTQNMAKTYAAKNHDYGNSFEESLDKFGLVASVVRLGDKMNRIESLTKKEAQVKDESVKDTLLDMANYAVMTVMWMDKKSGE